MVRLPFLNFFKKQNNNVKPVVLLVLDGFGIAPHSAGNAITQAKTPNYTSYLKNFPHGELIASGESVGLPANEVGNTEVGHLTMGAGRTIYQDLKRINLAIENRTFFDNKAFIKASFHAKKNNSKFHILSLVSSGNVHSSLSHLLALIQFCKKEDITNLHLHLFTDGRDAPPQEGIDIISKVEEHLKNLSLGRIATISGRYYAMDRDRRWERTRKAFDAIVLGKGVLAESASQAIKNSYAKGQTDEFVEPTVITGQNNTSSTLDDGDAVVFCNFRVDRPRQLTMALVLPDFENLRSFDFGYDPDTRRQEGKVEFGQTFTRDKVVNNLCFVTMTEYQKDLPVSDIAFGTEVVESPFPLVVSERGLKQLQMSESEKERFVTYYFSGMRETSLPGCGIKIVPSSKVATYDRKPQMSLPELTAAFKKELSKNLYHFAIINFANPDMVAHTGNLAATIKAIEYVDNYMGEIVDVTLAKDGIVIITADHGNAEEMVTYPTSTYFFTTSQGRVNTDHSNNPVPLIVVANSFKGKKTILPKGALSDIAPTILSLMGLQVPSVMTGKNLLQGFATSQEKL